MKRMTRATVGLWMRAGMLGVALPLFGTEVFWSGATSRNWHTPSNWSVGSVPTDEDVAVFDPAQQPVTRWAFLLTNSVSVAGLRFTNLTQAVHGDAEGGAALAVGAAGVCVSGADVALALPCAVAAPQTWSVSEGCELVHSGGLRGAATLTKAGEGRVWLKGQSIFTGSYRVEAGTLKSVSAYEAPVMDGLAVWLDASAAATLATDSAGEITVWSNRVGKSATTPLGGGGPLWVADAVRGKPAARFQRVNNKGLIMLSGYENTTHTATAFAVMQRRTLQTANAGVLSLYKDGERDYDTPNGAVFFQMGGSAPFNSLKGTRNGWQTGNIFVPQETPFCLMSRFNGKSHTVVQDGELVGSVGTNPLYAQPFAANRLLLGNRPVSSYAYPFNGDVAEVLVYNRTLTPAEEQHVAHYLREKWLASDTPGALLNGASLWFDAASPETLVTNAEGGVLAWSNRVSECALTPFSSELPQLAEENGLPAVRFDKDLTNGLQLGSGYYHRGKALTVFASLIPSDSQYDKTGVASFIKNGGLDWNSTAGTVVFFLNGTGNGQQWGARREGVTLGYAYLVPGRSSVLMSRFDGATHAITVNGIPGAPPVACEQTFDANMLRLGTRSADGNTVTFNGDVQEMLVFNRALSDAEAAKVEAYLAAKWRRADDLDALLAEADLRVDASDAASVTTNADGRVTAWTDPRTGAALTVPATNDCAGPLWVQDAMNGRPVMRFDNTQKTALFLESSYSNTDVQLTAFVMLRRGAAMDANAGLLSVYKSGSTDHNRTDSAALAWSPSSTTNYFWVATRNNDRLSACHDVPAGTPVCLVSSFDGYRHVMAVDGAASAGVQAHRRFNVDRLSVGARPVNGMTCHFTGDIAEALVYNRALSASETARIRTYLREKWRSSAEDTPDGLCGRARVWLDASAAETLATDAAGHVLAWSNRVARGQASMVPPPGLAGPTVAADAMNGRAALHFDKDATVKQALLADTFSLTGETATAVVVLRRREAQVTDARVLTVWKDGEDDHNSVNGGVFVYAWDGTNYFGYREEKRKSGYSGLSAETTVCLVSRFDGAAHRMIMNGREWGAPAASEGAFNADRFALSLRASGKSQPFNGDIAEVLLFDFALTPGQIQTLTTYLQDKWVNPVPGGALRGAPSVEIRGSAELDVRDAGGLVVQRGGRLFGAGGVRGPVTVEAGGRIEAVSQGDGVLKIDGELVFRTGAVIAADYADGRPLIDVTGLVRLPVGMIWSVTNLAQVTETCTIPLLQGKAWDNGQGETPEAALWTLEGTDGSVSFLLDEAAHRVNLRIRRGTLIWVY